MAMSRRLMRLLLITVPCLTLLLAGLLVRPLLPAKAAVSSITLSQAFGSPTTPVKVSGTAFNSSETITLNFGTTQVGTATADSTGTFTTEISIPASALPGSHSILATGQVSGTSAQATFVVRTDWNEFGFKSSHTHFNYYENVLNASNAANLVVDWTAATGVPGNASSKSSPLVAYGLVYVGANNGYLYAFDFYTGGSTWATLTGGPIIATPAIANGVIYVGSTDHKLYALNAKTGTLLWTYTTGASISSAPTVVNGVVYFGSDDTSLYALNAKTGVLLWTYATGGAIQSAPAVATGVVYIGSTDNKVYAFNATTGGLIWTYTTGGPIYSSPAVYALTVYVGSTDLRLYALGVKTGKLRWVYTSGGPIISSPAVANSVVYVGSEDTRLYALDLTTGKLLWSFTTYGPIDSSPAVANGIVYVGSGIGGTNGYLYDLTLGCSSPPCAQSHLYTLGAAAESSPAVANGVVYIGANNNTLYAFHLTGTTP